MKTVKVYKTEKSVGNYVIPTDEEILYLFETETIDFYSSKMLSDEEIQELLIKGSIQYRIRELMVFVMYADDNKEFLILNRFNKIKINLINNEVICRDFNENRIVLKPSEVMSLIFPKINLVERLKDNSKLCLIDYYSLINNTFVKERKLI